MKGTLITCLHLLLLSAGASAAQEVREIRFATGSDSATVSDAVERGSRHYYSFVARKGQTAEIRITAVESNAAFTLWRPGVVLGQDRDASIRGHALPGAGEGADTNHWQGRLPESGSYVVVVGPTRGNATYQLRLIIGTAATTPAPASSPAIPAK